MPQGALTDVRNIEPTSKKCRQGTYVLGLDGVAEAILGWLWMLPGDKVYLTLTRINPRPHIKAMSMAAVVGAVVVITMENVVSW